MKYLAAPRTGQKIFFVIRLGDAQAGEKLLGSRAQECCHDTQ
jgi:hypothetical protein